MIEILQYDFMRNALIAGLLASIACGVVGSFIVVKRMVFISGGIAHSSFGGIGLGYLLGFNPIIGALIFSLLSALGISLITEKGGHRQDTAIGILWAFGMALGIIFIGLTSRYAPDLFSYLFGNILTVPDSDLILMVILDIIIVGIIFLLYKELLAISFDEEHASISGIPSTKLNLMIMCLIALTVVMLIRIVGMILVIALLTIPAAVSELFNTRLKNIIFHSVIISSIFAIAGLSLSYTFDLASGATIILIASITFFIAILIKNLCS